MRCSVRTIVPLPIEPEAGDWAILLDHFFELAVLPCMEFVGRDVQYFHCIVITRWVQIVANAHAMLVAGIGELPEHITFAVLPQRRGLFPLHGKGRREG